MLPEDGGEPSLDLKEAFKAQGRVEVYLAVPQWQSGRPNVGPDSPSPRFLVDHLSLEDENTGVGPQPVSVRRLNVKLMFGHDDHAGYETLSLARLVKSDRAEATPKLDTTFIPPLLACDAWPTLQNDILQQIFFRLNTKIEVMAAQVKSRGISFDSHSPGDGRRMHQLCQMNEAYSLLSNLAFVPGLHPLPAYLELCRLVGQLSVLSETARPPELPRYDHDDLGGCFYRVKVYLDTLLDILPEPEYKERPFVGMGLRMQAAIEPTWLDPAWELYLGVRSEMDPDEMMRLLTVPGQLDMKAGSGDRVDAIYQLGQAGLRFEPCPKPGLLPDLAGQRYCRLSRQPEREWGAVTRSLTVAVRFNETRVVGAIQGQRAVTVRAAGGRTNTMQFTLYAVPAG